MLLSESKNYKFGSDKSSKMGYFWNKDIIGLESERFTGSAKDYNDTPDMSAANVALAEKFNNLFV